MPTMQPAEDFGRTFEELAAGKYHFAILESRIHPEKRDKSGVLDGFEVKFQVREGTTRANGVCTEIGKVFTEDFIFPQESHKDGGTMCQQRITNLLVAAGVMTEEQRKTGGAVTYYLGGEGQPDPRDPTKERDDLRGMQVIAFIKTKPSKGKDGREWLNPEIDGTNIYHVHNPKVASIPKDVQAAKLMRMPTAYQPKLEQPPANGSSNGNGSAAKQPEPVSVAAGSAAGDMDLSDL